MKGTRLFPIVAVLAVFFPGFALALEPSGMLAPEVPKAESTGLLEALQSGKVHLNVRIRTEYADAEGLQASQAHTARTRIGYRTGEYKNLSAYIEMEDIRAANYDRYNAAGVNGEGTRTVIADPEDTELNQFYVDAKLASLDGKLRAGRQRVILDDSRWVGNVGWRQNEQTLDAAMLQAKAGDSLSVKYVYLWGVQRIFGDSRDGSAALRDFDSDSHLVNATLEQVPGGKLTLFAYLLDFHGSNSGAAANSSETYGFLYKGKTGAGDNTEVGYDLSLAHQNDGRGNMAHYNALYYLAQGRVTVKGTGSLIVGYEVLGTDSGMAQVRTPLATAHKFNGWADSFLDNAGPTGLRDIFVTVQPNLPNEIVAKATYHTFHNDHGGGDLGWELDALVAKSISPNLKLLCKYAYFDGKADADIQRLWVELTLAF